MSGVRFLVIPLFALLLATAACWSDQNLGVLKPDKVSTFTLYGEVPSTWNIAVRPNIKYEVNLQNTSRDYPLTETAIYMLIAVYKGDNKPIYLDASITFSEYGAHLEFTVPNGFSLVTLSVGSKTGEGTKSYGSFTVELAELN
jgi:hypothetical protein